MNRSITIPTLCVLVLFIPSISNAQISSNFGGANGGAVVVGESTTTCDASAKAAIRWNDTDKNHEFCDGSNWRKLVGEPAVTDNTPDAFTFTDLTGQSLGILVNSNSVNVTGFNGPIAATVSGGGSPQISVNGGAWVASAAISSGDSLQVRMTTSTGVSTELIAAVTVGTVTDNWSVTTKAGQTQIFITQNTYAGAHGSVANADSTCQSEAGVLGYSGSWKAILSDNTTDARDHVTVTYPVVRASDTSVVVDASNLWDGNLQNAVSTSGYNVWTGTHPAGDVDSDNCGNWTGSDNRGVYGDSDDTTDRWLQTSAGGTSSCPTAMMRFYCIEQ